MFVSHWIIHINNCQIYIILLQPMGYDIHYYEITSIGIVQYCIQIVIQHYTWLQIARFKRSYGAGHGGSVYNGNKNHHRGGSHSSQSDGSHSSDESHHSHGGHHSYGGHHNVGSGSEESHGGDSSESSEEHIPHHVPHTQCPAHCPAGPPGPPGPPGDAGVAHPPPPGKYS